MGYSYPANPDRLAALVASMSREQLKPRLMSFPSRTRLDFTEDFLDKLSTEQLRHILFAAMLYLRPE